MGGGLMQLVAYGAQDIYLTGNPQITFFKVVYRRHTNFSMESIQQTINGTQSPAAAGGANGNVTISRNGDLVHKIYVRVTAPAALVTSDGNDIVDVVELEIGGQKIDKHTAEYMKVMNELTTPESKAIGLKALTGGIGTWGFTAATGVQVCMVPLQFWFCRNPGLALPLIALQYHEVKLKFTWGVFTGAANANCDVFCDYIYLDTDERRRFAQQSHEYLIEQVQHQAEGTAARDYKLNLNHPVKELIWTTTAAGLTTQDTKLSLNGHDRFSNQRAEYFQLRQPLDHHSAVPRQNLPNAAKFSDNLSTIGSDVATAATFTSVSGQGSEAGAAVGATGNVIVSNTVVATDMTATEAAATTVYVFLTTAGLAVNALTAGKTYLITGSGTNFGTNGNATSVVATCVQCAVGGTAGAAANIHANNTSVNFDRRIDNGTAATLINAAAFSITDIQELSPQASQFDESRTSRLTSNINVYSFALKPEEHQPSGTCNFSRIDTAKLEFSAAATVENIYAVNYNVLRIMSGMGGLAYSN
jgi:hypothetical protein